MTNLFLFLFSSISISHKFLLLNKQSFILKYDEVYFIKQLEKVRNKLRLETPLKLRDSHFEKTSGTARAEASLF